MYGAQPGDVIRQRIVDSCASGVVYRAEGPFTADANGFVSQIYTASTPSAAWHAIDTLERGDVGGIQYWDDSFSTLLACCDFSTTRSNKLSDGLSSDSDSPKTPKTPETPKPPKSKPPKN